MMLSFLEGKFMVLTSYGYHLLFEPIRENECIFLPNDLLKGNKSLTNTLHKVKLDRRQNDRISNIRHIKPN